MVTMIADAARMCSMAHFQRNGVNITTIGYIIGSVCGSTGEQEDTRRRHVVILNSGWSVGFEDLNAHRAHP